MLGTCRRDCLHRAMVMQYRDARHAWEERREQGEAMQMEDDDYRAAFPPPTFKDWLRGYPWPSTSDQEGAA